MMVMPPYRPGLLIGLAGGPQVGKNEAARALITEGFIRVSVYARAYDTIGTMFDLAPCELADDQVQRDRILARTAAGRSITLAPIELIQSLMKWAEEWDPDMWTALLAQNIRSIGGPVVVTSIHNDALADMIHQLGGYVVYIAPSREYIPGRLCVQTDEPRPTSWLQSLPGVASVTQYWRGDSATIKPDPYAHGTHVHVENIDYTVVNDLEIIDLHVMMKAAVSRLRRENDARKSSQSSE